MKKLLLTTTMFLVLATVLRVEAQICRLVKDSVIAGADSSATADYVYNTQNQLVRVNKSDSGSLTINTFYTLDYNSNGDLTHLRYFPMDTSTVPEEVILLTYNSNNRVIRYTLYNYDFGDTIVWNVNYNTSNQLESLEWDSTLSNAIENSFIDITWSNGNIASFGIVEHWSPQDTFEVITSFDNANNLYRHFGETVPDLVLFRNNQNNLLALRLRNNETIGQAGDTIIDRRYTYTSQNEVQTLTNFPRLIFNRFYTIAYRYACQTGMASTREDDFHVFPNPMKDYLQVRSTRDMDFIRLTDMTGKTVWQGNNPGNTTIDLSFLNPGTYLLSAGNKAGVHQQKIVVTE